MHPAGLSGAYPSLEVQKVSISQGEFADLVRQHQSMVYSIAYHYLWDQALAEEAAQEVFLELFRSGGRIESDQHLLHWLRQVAARKAIDAGRRRTRRAEVGLDEAPEARASEGRSDLLASELLGRLVATLPEKQRLAVILRYQEDLDPAEIARLLDVPHTTVKSSLHRALELLRAKAPEALKEVPR